MMLATPAGMHLDTQWVQLSNKQTKRAPASAEEQATTYFCALCCVAEAAKPAAARIAAGEFLAFKGLPAYMEHCLSLDGRHVMHVRAWRAAYKHVCTKVGIVNLGPQGPHVEEVARLAQAAVALLTREPGSDRGVP